VSMKTGKHGRSSVLVRGNKATEFNLPVKMHLGLPCRTKQHGLDKVKKPMMQPSLQAKQKYTVCFFHIRLSLFEKCLLCQTLY